MSALYTQCSGMSKTTATRRGSVSSGVKSTVQSWNGSVITEMNYDANDNLIVTISTSTGSSAYGTQVFKGTFEEYVNKLQSK